jgi:4-hydroxy-tetrahydrodipicolinate synthase
MAYEGVYTALVTPFRGDAVDEGALRELVERNIAGGVSGLVPCGTTGESVTLHGDEPGRVMRIVVEQAKKRVPVIAGTGTVSTRHTVELSRVAKEAGADGLLLVCPYYNRPTQAGLEAHFRHVLKEVPMPAVLYNIPGRTGVDLAVETLEALADVKEIVAIKEATGNVIRAQDILARFGSRFAVLSGDDSLTLPMLAVGGSGVISVTSNVFPAQVSGVTAAWSAGDVKGARERHLALVPVHNAMFLESNPGPVKYAMSLGGHIAPEIRLPLVWPKEATQERLRAVMGSAGLTP